MRQASTVTIRPANAEAYATAAPARKPSLALVDVAQAHDQLAFDRFVLTPGERLLTRDGEPIEIGGRSFDLLVALVEQPGRVVPKRELLQRVWPGVMVEDSVLRFHMTRLRRSLNDGRDGARLIATQVGVGYAFVGQLCRAPPFAVAPPAQRRPPSVLPGRLDRSFGREGDLSALIERAAGARLQTITGPAGVGKSSLAIEMAHDVTARYHERIIYADLTMVSADAVPATVASALGMDVGPVAHTGELLEHLNCGQGFLILDNCEHVIQATADLVERIVQAAPQIQIVVTSRQPLRARGEHVYRLKPYDIPDCAAACDRDMLLACPAVELFLHHATRAGAAMRTDFETLQAIALICLRLDGLALAIELAAMRAATHGVNATARMLDEGLILDWPGRRTSPVRQRAMRSMLDWSYALLTDHERDLFERLSTLAGPFSLQTALNAADRDLSDHASTAAALDELVDKSLILAQDGSYYWFELSRLYAKERLRARASERTRAPVFATLPRLRHI